MRVVSASVCGREVGWKAIDAAPQEEWDVMRFRGLDLNLLVALDALFETRSVTKAGKRLNLSQSAMSSALSRLRSYFNDELLVAKMGHAGTKEMVTTAFGKSLEEPVRALLAELQVTLSRPAAFDLATCDEHIKIIAPDFIEILLLTKVVRRASEMAPFMTFEISGGGTNEEAVTELNRSMTDFVIASPPHLAPGHPSEPLLKDTSVCLGCATNGLLERPVSQETLESLKRIELKKVHSDRLMNISGTQLSVIRSDNPLLIVENLANIAEYIIDTSLVCIVPQKLAVQFARARPLRYAEIENLDQPIEFFIQWNRSFARDPARAWFRQLAVSIANEI